MRGLPGLAFNATGRRGANFRCSHRLVSRLAGKHKLNLLRRPLAGLRQQMEVWFYLE
jgi:hypothetical protein